MKINTFCFIVFTFLILNMPLLSQSFSGVNVNYVFMIDKSKSMIGIDGPADIFDFVKETINNFITELNSGNVYIFPFSAGLHKDEIRSFSINKSPQDNEKIKKYVNGLVADGKDTWIYDSFESIVDNITPQINENRDGPNYIIYYIYTDGIDTQNKYNMQKLCDDFLAQKIEHKWLYYTTLGIELDTVGKQLNDKEKVIVEQHKNDKTILDQYSDDNIFTISEAKEKISPIQIVLVGLQKINFGNLKKGFQNTASVTRDFEIPLQFNLSKNINNIDLVIKSDLVQLDGNGAVASVGPANVKLDEFIPLTLTIHNANNISKEGKFGGKIRIGSNDATVDILQNELEYYFFWEDVRKVEINSNSIADSILNIELTPDVKQTEIYNFELVFSKNARNNNSKLNVKVIQRDKNKSNLVKLGGVAINNNNVAEATISSEENELKITFKENEEIEPGEYYGDIFFSSDDLELNGSLLKEKPNIYNAKYIGWKLIVKSRPIPSLYKILTLILLIFLFLFAGYKYYLFKLPKLEGSLSVKEDRSEEFIIDLSREDGKTRREGLLIGRESANYLSHLNSQIVVLPKRIKGKLKMQINVKEGIVKLNGDPTVSEYIYDSDKITIDEPGKSVVIIYSNFKNERPQTDNDDFETI